MEHFDWYMGVFVPFVNFAIFFGAALFFFRKPLRSLIDGRRQKFESAQQQAEAALIEAKKDMQQLEKRKAQLGAELEQMRKQSIDNAQKESSAIVTNAEKLSERLRLEAEKSAQSLVDKAARDLESRVLELAKNVVTKQIEETLDQSAQENMLSKQIASLDTALNKEVKS